MLRNFSISKFTRAIAMVSAVAASTALADDFDKRLKTVYLSVDYGLSTYKSKLVDSNDTGSIVSYSIGANIGAEKPIAFVIRTDQSAITFALNESNITTDWRDTIMRYRWGYMYVGAVMGNTTWAVKSAGADLFAGTGSGYGGNLGVMFPIGSRNLFSIDVTSLTASTFVEKNEQDVKMGARTDVNAYANIGLTRDSLDLIVGYRQRSHSVSFLGSSYAELHSATFIGFQVGADF